MAAIREIYGEDEIITLDYDDGKRIQCGIMGIFEADGASYMALDNPESSEVYLYRYLSLEDSFQLEEITDKAEFARVSEAFDQIMAERY